MVISFALVISELFECLCRYLEKSSYNHQAYVE